MLYRATLALFLAAAPIAAFAQIALTGEVAMGVVADGSGASIATRTRAKITAAVTTDAGLEFGAVLPVDGFTGGAGCFATPTIRPGCAGGARNGATGTGAPQFYLQTR